MVMKRTLLLTTPIIFFYYVFTSVSLSNAAEVTLAVGNGLGTRGSNCCNPNYPDNNRVEISLDNPNHRVKKVQVNITDVDNYLEVSGCELSDRADGFYCLALEQPEGHVMVVVMSSTGAKIEKGTGPICTLKYNVKTSAIAEQCRNLNPSVVEILDEYNNSLSSTALPGEFCFYHCATALHCDDGLFCNGEESCPNKYCISSGLDPCTPLLCSEASDECYCTTDEQCSDGEWCTGVETCVGGDCRPGTYQCANDYDPCTEDCQESAQTCLHICTAEGPWDPCCQSSSVCGAAAICNEDVTVQIGNGSGDRSSSNNPVSVSLYNPNDKVKAIQMMICDVDDYLTLSSCVATSRAVGYGCYVDEKSDGCASVLLSPPLAGAPINKGTGPVLTLKYDVSGTAPFGQCRDLNIDTEDLEVSFTVVDEFNQALIAMPVSGEFCVNCYTSAGCNDNNDCTSEVCTDHRCIYTNKTGTACNDWVDCTQNDICKNGVCLGTDPCPDDGDYCSGVEYCTEGTGYTCDATGDPCAGGLTCDEIDEVCDTSEVMLIVANAYGSPGMIDIELNNSSDEVSEVHLDVCNVDQRAWLHIISTTQCSITSRTAGFQCSFNGLCAFSGNPCGGEYGACTGRCDGTGKYCLCNSDDECDPLYQCAPGEICDGCVLDLGNGCVGVDITSPLPIDVIEMGSGPIAQLSYTLDDPSLTIPLENYADLNPENIEVKDDVGSALSVTPTPGRVYKARYCKGDLNHSGAVDGIDTNLYKQDYGRNPFKHPCTPADPCLGDLNCSGAVDGVDTNLYKQDYGRNQFSNPCPPYTSQFDCF